LRLASHWLADPLAAVQRLDTRRKRKRTTFLSAAPYPIRLYENLLEQLVRLPGLRVGGFEQPQSRAHRPPLAIIRHDIDTRECLARASLLLDVNRQLGMESAVFVRTDGAEYAPGEARMLVRYCASAGIAVGLHSSCYLAGDVMGTFWQERTRFTQEFGFRPSLLTMHGSGAHRLRERRRFVATVAADQSRYGLRFTDASPGLRRYAHVFEDCHQERRSKARVLRSDFTDPARFVRGWGVYLVLTHPCYWRD
jgi:hypothetical protein